MYEGQNIVMKTGEDLRHPRHQSWPLQAPLIRRNLLSVCLSVQSSIYRTDIAEHAKGQY